MGTGSSIYYLPSLSIWENQAIGTMVIGMPGSGKTFFLQNTAANCCAMGQRIIVIDPKNDFARLKNIVSDVEIIDINNITPGALNPFIFLKDCNAQVLLTIIQLICGNLSDKDIITLTPILSDFVKEADRKGYVDMQDVADYLYSNPKESAQKIGSVLRMNSDSGYGSLLFTRKRDIVPLRIPDEKSVIISLFGMKFPDYTKDIANYTAEEKFTSAIVYIVCKRLQEILTGRQKVPTTLFCDEAHILYASKEMTEIIDHFLVLGRSLNIAVVLASQGISHFPDNIDQFVSHKFMFKSSMNESEKFLRRFDTSKIDTSKEIDKESVIGATANLETGSCFYIDHKGRSGFIHIISNYDINLLSSNPLARGEE